jgi:hypothetical protein
MEDMAVRFGPEPMTVELDWCSECGETLHRGDPIYGTQKKGQPWRKTCVKCVEKYRAEREGILQSPERIPQEFVVTLVETPDARPRYSVGVNGVHVYGSNNLTGCREVERFLRINGACAETAYWQSAPRWETE